MYALRCITYFGWSVVTRLIRLHDNGLQLLELTSSLSPWRQYIICERHILLAFINYWMIFHFIFFKPFRWMNKCISYCSRDYTPPSPKSCRKLAWGILCLHNRGHCTKQKELMGTNKANLLYFALTKLKKTMCMCICSATVWDCGLLLNNLFLLLF